MSGCPMLVVDDVEASADWYAGILGGVNAHPGPEFSMIMLGSRLVLMLHHRDFSEHPTLTAPGATPGAGVLLYFWVADVHAAHARALERGAAVAGKPKMNPNARAVEFSLRDPDGYAVTVAQAGEWQEPPA